MKSRAVVSLAVLALLSGGCSKEEKELVPEKADLSRPEESWLQVEAVRLLRDYVRIETTQEKGEEEGARFLRDFFECEGIESEIVCPAPRRCNLLARLPGRRRTGALLLLNHIDVVPAFADFWKDAPPFEGKIRQGFLYGRGAYDVKSLALAQALALRTLKRRGIVPKSDILFLAEADEEIGQRWGSRWLLENRPDWFEGVGQVLNEGGMAEMILRDIRFWGVETVQAGYASAELEAQGSEALESLAARWRKLRSPAVEPHPHVVEGFNLLANHLVHPLTDPLRHLDRVRKNPEELARLPDRYGSFLEARIFWSPPYPYPPKTPGKYRSYLIISVPPGVSPERYLRPILRQAEESKFRITHSFVSEVSTASPYPTSFTELLKRLTEAHHPGVPFGPAPTSGGYSTSVLFRQRGIPTYGYSSVPMNITDASRRHGNDERVYLRDYVNGVGLYEDLLEEFALIF